MENKYILSPNGELYHWGIKGKNHGNIEMWFGIQSSLKLKLLKPKSLIGKGI